MNINSYKVLIKIAELGSITKAAFALNYTQPNISHILTAVENEVGFPVFIRSKDSVILTENGRKILNHCYQIIESEDALNQTVSIINGLSSGTIRIGALNSMLVDFVPKMITEFGKAYSNIETQIFEQNYIEIYANLQNSTIDVGFVDGLDLPQVEFTPLFEAPFCVIMHEDHPLSEYNTINVRQLNGCNFIMFPQDAPDVMNYVFRETDFKPIIKHWTASDTAAITMVSYNLGLYLLLKPQEKLLPDNVVMRHLEGNFNRKLGMAIKSFEHASPAAKAFVKTVQKTCKT